VKRYLWSLPFVFITNTFSAYGITLKLVDEFNRPVPLAMVTEKVEQSLCDNSDYGYPQPNVAKKVLPEISKFSDDQGLVTFSPRESVTGYRIRKFSYLDQMVEGTKKNELKVVVEKETNPVKLAAARPANTWLGALNVGSEKDKIIFQMQCGYCHQQGTEFTRQERSEKDWDETIKRMVRYGSRLPTDLQKSLPNILIKEFSRLRNNPSLIPDPMPWRNHLKKTTLKEWPIGDEISQTHDILVAENGLVYVADNI
jgi:virginiamycin B lyase